MLYYTFSEISCIKTEIPEMENPSKDSITSIHNNQIGYDGVPITFLMGHPCLNIIFYLIGKLY